MRTSLNSKNEILRLPNTVRKSRNNESMSRKSESRNRKRAISPITQLVHTLKTSYENTKKGRSIVSPKRTRLSKLIQSFQAPKERPKFSKNISFENDNDRPLGTLEFINKVKTNLEKIKISKRPRRKVSMKSRKVQKTENLKLRYYLNNQSVVHKSKSKSKKRRSKVAKTNSFSLNGSDLISPRQAHRSQFSFFISDNDLSLVPAKAGLPMPRLNKRKDGFLPPSKQASKKGENVRKSLKKQNGLFDAIQRMRIKHSRQTQEI